MNYLEIAQAYDRYTDKLLEQYYSEQEEEEECDDDFDDYDRYHCLGAGGWR